MSLTFKTCAEAGFPLKQVADWLYCAEFNASINDRADAAAMQHLLQHRFGPEFFQFIVDENDQGQVRRVFLVIADVPQVVEFTADHLEVALRGEHILDEFYWDIVDPLIQKAWDTASLAQRIRWADEAEAPPGDVMLAEVSADISTIIYRSLAL